MFMVVGMTMLMVMVAAGVAVAVAKTCGENLPCRGTDDNDVISERDGTAPNFNGNGLRDRILALDGNDDVQAATFDRDRDSLDGGRGRDHLFTNDGDRRDTSRGGRGRDTCVRDEGDGARSCENIRTEAAGFLPAEFGDTASN
jgi:hypothetical protein